MHRRTNVSFVFQNYNLIDYMTPEENVKLAATQEPGPVLEILARIPDKLRIRKNKILFHITFRNIIALHPKCSFNAKYADDFQPMGRNIFLYFIWQIFVIQPHGKGIPYGKLIPLGETLIPDGRVCRRSVFFCKRS